MIVLGVLAFASPSAAQFGSIFNDPPPRPPGNVPVGPPADDDRYYQTRPQVWPREPQQVAPPPNWGYIGDASSIVMPNGKFLLGNKIDMRIVELDPATMAWTELGTAGKADFNAEEGWTLVSLVGLPLRQGGVAFGLEGASITTKAMLGGLYARDWPSAVDPERAAAPGS